MTRQIERNDAKILRDVGVAQLMAIFATVGAGGMQADKGDPLAVFLVVDSIFLPGVRNVYITSDDRIGLSHFR